jgi:hypothetical protein
MAEEPEFPFSVDFAGRGGLTEFRTEHDVAILDGAGDGRVELGPG